MKLTRAEIDEIRHRIKNNGEPTSAVAEGFGITRNYAQKIANSQQPPKSPGAIHTDADREVIERQRLLSSWPALVT